MKLGVFPVRNHYYEPQFDYRNGLPTAERKLPGIEWNVSEHLAFLESLTYASELPAVFAESSDPFAPSLANNSFCSGDAEVWYQVIRHAKPRRIVEIGSGNSTRIAIAAIRRNHQEDPDYHCEHICIEPYEMPWLEGTGASIVRSKVEDVDPSLFSRLERNDILFIDSSHVIRPGGDVLCEYLEILPRLQSGVIVHIHDIFTPNHYPPAWLVDEVRLWNEQYLLEAFLTNNSVWKILAPLSFLFAHHPDSMLRVAPFLTSERNPGSFYMQKKSTDTA